MWGLTPVDVMCDYLKLKKGSYTPLGIVLYPILAPFFLLILGYLLLASGIYWMYLKIKRKLS
jgi:hypothetical protein